jgi:predicted phosphodiesterase
VRIAVLSDIHANVEAFQAVVQDFTQQAENILHLGDMVGYNASPNECVELARKFHVDTIKGNHDHAVCHPEFAENFNIYARSAALWTRQHLTPENIQFLSKLEKTLSMPYGLACHGTPTSMSGYVELHFQAKSILKGMKKGVWGDTRVCLYGHTHKRKVWRMDVRGKVAPVEIPPDGVIQLNGEEFYLLNPGSVGQPRNGDPRSSYFIFDTEKNTVSFRLVQYDLDSAMEKIMHTELPEFFASRLMYGK